MPQIKSFDRFVIFLLLGVAGLIMVLLLFGDRVGVQPEAVVPPPGEAISMRGRIGMTFDEPMDAFSVESHFTITPQIDGLFSWDDAYTFWFLPAGLLDPETDYEVTISAGAEAESGRRLLRDYTWAVTVRQPDILYLVLGDIGGDLWRHEIDSGNSKPLTNTGGKVFDFAPDGNGEWIVFAQVNPRGGSDLWMIDREGADPIMIIDCHLDHCSQPTWSPDGDWIAYSREEFSLEDSLHEPARVWTLFIPTTETNRLYDNPDAFSHSPSFSPDGQRLATYNTNQNAIRILNLETSQESVIPSVLLGVGDWSPDGRKMLYTDLVPSILEPNVGVYIADLENQGVEHAFGEFIPDTDFSPPRWSPDGKWVAFAARPVGGGISKRIWIVNLDGEESIPITNDPTATFTNYRWDPWGEQLVFQRFPISGPSTHASLWLWERATGETRMLVENGARPEWLP